jgi:hypothetical protein
MTTRALLLLLGLLLPVAAHAETRAISLMKLEGPALGLIHKETGTIAASLNARDLVRAALREAGRDTDIGDDFACLIHLVRWTKASEDSGHTRQIVQSSRWYLYDSASDWTGDHFVGSRIFGRSSIWILSVQLNVLTSDVAQLQPVYDVKATAKKPAQIVSLTSLLELVIPKTAAPAGTDKTTPPAPVHGWGIEPFDVPAVSDVLVSATMALDASNTNGNGNGGSAHGISLGDPITLDNEGKTWWDASVGVPLRGKKDLEFDDSGSASPRTISKSTAFALLNLFVRPVDLKSPASRAFQRRSSAWGSPRATCSSAPHGARRWRTSTARPYSCGRRAAATSASRSSDSG